MQISVEAGKPMSMKFVSNPDIKFCDFGLAQNFNPTKNPKFLCNKHVGKTSYKSPEIYEKKKDFDARASDIWSVGICLFGMVFGSFPFVEPSPTNSSFEWVISGQVSNLIDSWKKTQYANPHILEIMTAIFKPENERIGTRTLLSHPWLR